MYNITTESIAIYDDKLYAVGRELSIVFVVDLKTNSTRILPQIPDEDSFQDRLFNGICVNSNYIVLIPYNAKKIWVYHFESNSWSPIEIRDYVSPEKEGKYVGGYLNNSIILLFGYKKNGILYVDISTGKTRELKNGEIDKESFWGQNYVVRGEYLYLAPLRKNTLIRLSTDDWSVEKYNHLSISDGETNSNCGIVDGEEDFYIIKHHGNKIYRWRPEILETSEIEIDEYFTDNKPHYNGATYFDRKLFFYSPVGNSYLFELDDNSRSALYEHETYYSKYDKEYGLFVCYKGFINRFDKSMNVKDTYHTRIDENTFITHTKSARIDSKLLKENDIVGLKEFLGVIADKEGV